MAAQRARFLTSTSFAVVCVLALGDFMALATPAQAEFGLGSFFQQLFGGGHHRHRPHRSKHHHSDNGDDSDMSSAAPALDDDSNRELAKLAPPTREQLALLKNVNASNSLGVVGSSDDQNASTGAAARDADRDYMAMIDKLVQTLKDKPGDSNTRGDVSEVAIMNALTSAILQTRLERFETFIGENWSAERLRSLILKRVTDERSGLLEDNDHGAVSMNDLSTMINKAAREVYARLFETSELLASDRSAALFTQRLYQAHSDLAKSDSREDARQLLLKASAEGLSHFKDKFARADYPYTLIYRAQRIISDCLSDNVESIVSVNTSIPSASEIEHRLLDTDAKQCTHWVSNQMLAPDGGLKQQEPMPLRAIWTASGPKDDPSMYGHASDQG